MANPGFEPKPVIAADGPFALGEESEDLRLIGVFKAEWASQCETLIAGLRRDVSEKVLMEAAGRAEILVRETLAKAEADASLIREAAEREGKVTAAAVVSEAEARAASIAEAARREGFARGEEEAGALVARLKTICAGAEAIRASALAGTETDLVELALRVARRVVGAASEKAEDLVTLSLGSAARILGSRRALRIRVSGADMESAGMAVARLAELASSAGAVELVADASIERGGCLVETDSGEIDARISSMLAVLETRLREIYSGPVAPREGVEGQ